MARLSIQDFRHALSDVIGEADRIVAVNGGLLRIGSQFGLPGPDLVRQLVDVLLEVVGPERTLVMSAYSWTFPKTRTFDLTLTKPATGALVIELLRRDGVVRTAAPMNSYAAVGPAADRICALRCTTAWGDDGVMGFLEREGARFVSVGMPLHKCSPYFHRGEQLVARHPYRYFKRFCGSWFIDGVPQGPIEEVLFVRPLGVRTRLDYRPVTESLAAAGQLVVGGNPALSVTATAVPHIISTTMSLLDEDPYMFVTNGPEVRDWVTAHLATEIASLAPEQRFESSIDGR